jgi:hypothetical protein
MRRPKSLLVLLLAICALSLSGCLRNFDYGPNATGINSTGPNSTLFGPNSTLFPLSPNSTDYFPVPNVTDGLGADVMEAADLPNTTTLP